MGRSNYRRGAAFENKVKADLVGRGYAATRSAGSHGLADLWAVKAGVTYFIQCKIDGRFGPKDWNGLFDLAQVHQGIAVLASRPVRGKIRYEILIGKKIPRSKERLAVEAMM